MRSGYNSGMELNSRLRTISQLLDTALDSEEEYLYRGEMSDYMRSYASDAAEELKWMLRASGPTADEIAYCVEALSDPERIKRGRSKELLVRLRESSRPLIDALGDSPDPKLRIFALEAGNTSINPYFPDPLYSTIALNRRLLDDPDEGVRAAALSTIQRTIVHNAAYIKLCLQQGDSNSFTDLMFRICELRDDAAPAVQAEAANVVSQWANVVDGETLKLLLERVASASRG